MSYSTITDLLRWVNAEELVRLCSLRGEATIASKDVQDVAVEVIENADSQIDSYLLGRWPGLRSFDPVPDEGRAVVDNLMAQENYEYGSSKPTPRERAAGKLGRALQAIAAAPEEDHG